MGSSIKEGIDRRQFLKAFALGAAGLGGAALLGCKSSNENENIGKPLSSPTATPEQTPRKEGLAGQLGFLPFEVLSDGLPKNDSPDSIYHLREGFRWAIIKLAVENLSKEPITLDNDLLQVTSPLLQDATITTAQGFKYPVLDFVNLTHGEVTHNSPIKIPPGFKLTSLQANPDRIIDPAELYKGAVDEQGNPYNYELYAKLNSCMAFVAVQVPQNATGLKLNIPGYDALDLDKVVSENASKPAYDMPESEFENAIGGSVMTPDGNIQVTIKDFKKLEDPQSIIPGPTDKNLYERYQFHSVVLSYANPDQGYAHSGKLTMYSVTENGDVYIVYDTSDPNSEPSGYIGFDEIGPGFSKDLIVNLVLPSSIANAKFVLQGRELGVFNAPLVTS